MRYFTIKELSNSSTAKAKGIDNTPNAETTRHLTELIEKLLDPLREAWGSAIKVTSGYRSWATNSAVGGSKSSAHMSGYAADIVPFNGKMKEFKSFIKSWLKDKMYDQFIDEHSKSSEWVHLGLKNSNGQQRRQNLIYKNGQYTLA